MQSFNHRQPIVIPSGVGKVQSMIRDAVEAVRPETKRERQARLATISLTNAGHEGSPWNGPKHVYAGTVPAHVKARRRAQNKRARMSRRANRSH